MVVLVRSGGQYRRGDRELSLHNRRLVGWLGELRRDKASFGRKKPAEKGSGGELAIDS